MENKQKILDLLLPCLRATRNLYDLESLTYDPDTETVLAVFPGGNTKVNVNLDSGTSMIRDVVKVLS